MWDIYVISCNAGICKNCGNLQKLREFAKIVRTCKNCENLQKLWFDE